MNTFTHVPPGFRFHPTDEELVDYYLRKKVASRRIDLDVIKDVDLYKIEPWDLQEICKIGTEEQNDWYFFSHKDKKYPTGTRTNRATAAGFWKATGRDKAIYSKHDLIGMRKTLVFYKGRAPNGQKSDWIMHEYRLETDENGTPQEEGWVVCRVFKKRVTSMRKVMSDQQESPCWYDEQVSLMQDFDSPPKQTCHQLPYTYPYPCKKEPYHFLHLPLLDTPKLVLQSSSSITANTNNPIPMPPYLLDHSTPQLIQDQQHLNFQATYNGNNINSNEESAVPVDPVTDWRELDKFVASQLSQDAPKDTIFQATDNILNTNVQFRHLDKQDQNASTSNSSCPIDLWK